MKFLPLIFILFAFTANAERLTTKVSHIEEGKSSREAHLILFENGRVGFLPSSEKSSLSTLKESMRRGEWLDVELDRKYKFLGGSVVAAPKNFSFTHEPDPTPEMSYVPTNLGSYTEANNIFLKMNRRHQRASQCYNRAHVWTYEEFQRSQLRSMKLFMFFTRSYIRRYNYKWWFHVTPMTYVNGTAMTMDRTFMKRPVEIKTWTDNFIYSKRNCPIISRYSQYRNNQEAEHCYLHPASMYYWQPRDLETNERNGFEKKQYVRSEVNWAYQEAF
ncbi:MAG: protein-glutamine glutaminase family protein [Bdellovibrionota bacterium]